MKTEPSKFLYDLFHRQDFINQFCPSLIALIMNDSDLITGYVTQKGSILTTPDLIKYLTDTQCPEILENFHD